MSLILRKSIISTGHHNYYDVANMQLSNCTKNIPSFLLFNNNGELHGFGQTTIGKLSSPRLEHPKSFEVKVCNYIDSTFRNYKNVYCRWVWIPLHPNVCYTWLTAHQATLTYTFSLLTHL